MEHILDNPAYNALSSGNKNLSNGNELAKYFSREVSPFTGIKEITKQNFELLYETIPFQGFFTFVSPEEIVIPSPWKVIDRIAVLQMVHDRSIKVSQADEKLVPLNQQHVPEMIALTKLTNPGPFNNRTIDFGHYKGLFKENKLVAMAGQRMNPLPYHEISAVCTHPDHLGKGYARQLIFDQISRIRSESGIPFLHSRSDNTRAIRVYESIGFLIRKEISIYVIQKE